MSRSPMHHATLVALLAALLIAAVAAAGALVVPSAAAAAVIAGAQRNAVSDITAFQANTRKSSSVQSPPPTRRHANVASSGAAHTPAGRVFTRAPLIHTDAGPRHTVTANPRT